MIYLYDSQRKWKLGYCEDTWLCGSIYIKDVWHFLFLLLQAMTRVGSWPAISYWSSPWWSSVTSSTYHTGWDNYLGRFILKLTSSLIGLHVPHTCGILHPLEHRISNCLKIVIQAYLFDPQNHTSFSILLLISNLH